MARRSSTSSAIIVFSAASARSCAAPNGGIITGPWQVIWYGAPSPRLLCHEAEHRLAMHYPGSEYGGLHGVLRAVRLGRGSTCSAILASMRPNAVSNPPSRSSASACAHI
jgi:hypothetical protein